MKKLSLLKIVSMYKAIAVFLAFALISLGCEQKDKQSMEKEHQYTNELIHETSPYLLQHAHNPVDWRAWNEETLALAKKENKLLLISVGYAACHWCHVMERESFEDSTVAAMMNEHFINVKVDREERPDVDQIYMNAVQLLTGRGGWPLNCIALPDGRPIWGGTYFPKENWMKALEQLATLYAEEPEKAEEYAQKLTEGVQQTGLVQLNEAEADFNLSQLDTAVSNWRESLDPNYGGRKGAPKFPMPVNLEFLLRYGVQKQDQALLDYVNLSLTKMAFGGIFDQVGGGFARYSVDDRWHIPHFEKMLYDNAQLVSLYAKAYKVFDKALYKEVVYRTVDFVEKELYNGKGAFYSSLDADSDNAEGELEEGAYYVWTKEELKGLLGEEMELFSKYYNINAFGKWEEDKYHLIRSVDDEVFAKENDLELSVLTEKRESWIATLDQEREKRDRPRLDDKTLTSWNALMLQGYVDAYAAFGDERFLNMAKTNANFIMNQLVQEDGGLYRNYKNGQSTLDAYLEDYAVVVQAFIGLYEQTLEASWLHSAKQLTDYCYDHFYDAQSKMFYFTSDREKSLITRKIETEDNVIPSSNAIMAHNLFKLGHYFDQKRMKENASAMLNNMTEMALQYGGGYAHWLDLFSNYNGEFYEIAVVGEAATERVKEITSQYLPNAMIVGSLKESSLPLLQYKYNEGETTIYVCIDGACKLPVKETAKALEQVSLSF